MPFGRKVANRILLATVTPLLVMFACGLGVAYFSGLEPHIIRYVVLQLLVLAPAFVLVCLMTRRFAVRLANLRRSAERIEHGDFAARLSTQSEGDELTDLAGAFNRMADVIAARETSQREQNHILATLNHRMESVLNATNDGIAMLDRGDRFTLVNRRFCELLGARADQLLHQTAGQALEEMPEAGTTEARELFHKVIEITRQGADGVVGVSEHTVELRVPERRFVQVYTAPVLTDEEGEWVGRILALRDVTRENELDQMKTDFISVVSHELRTPLTSIRGYTDLLLSGASGEVSELQQEFLGIIQASTNRLSNLINDILDISRIESGRIKLRLEPINYHMIVADVLRLMKASADEKDITFDASMPEQLPIVRGDADKVTQVLTNLVSNAIKYTPSGGWVKLLVEMTDDKQIQTCVQDSGIGISREDQKKLFQKFFRADNSSTREAGGTGLGLVIAKTIVELMGGAIWVESAPERGSRFYFTLPIATESGMEQQADQVVLPDRGIGLVLLIDDDPYMRGLVQHQLHRRGYGVIVSGSVPEALQKARQHKPNAILLNFMIADLDGLRILAALKEDPATESIPLIMVSVASDPARGILSLGTFSLLRHPGDDYRLARVIQDVAGHGEQEAPSMALLVTPAEGGCFGAEREEVLARTNSTLAEAGITICAATTASEALTLAITESAAIILIDMEIPADQMEQLITALKVEEEAARIPIVFLSNDLSDRGVRRLAGLQSTDANAVLDYLCEQVKDAVEKPTIGLHPVNASFG
jgi:PAS domain S-box-containing protein